MTQEDIDRTESHGRTVARLTMAMAETCAQNSPSVACSAAVSLLACVIEATKNEMPESYRQSLAAYMVQQRTALLGDDKIPEGFIVPTFVTREHVMLLMRTSLALREGTATAEQCEEAAKVLEVLSRAAH